MNSQKNTESKTLNLGFNEYFELLKYSEIKKGIPIVTHGFVQLFTL